MYPLRVTYSCLTRVQKATNTAEQRWVVRKPMVQMDATYTNLNTADYNSVQNFFESQKGQFDSTWTLDFAGKALTGMRFLSDELRWDERIPNRWTTRLIMAGFYPDPADPPVSLPPLPSGAVTQLPWNKRRTFQTGMNDLESGIRRAIAYRGGGLTNFPSYPELSWELSFSACTYDFAEQFIAYFLSKNGRFGGFTFTDPDSSLPYSDCHFASDDLDVQYVGFNRCSFSAVIVKQ